MPRVQDALPSLDCRAWKGRSNPLLLSTLRFAPESRGSGKILVDQAARRRLASVLKRPSSTAARTVATQCAPRGDHRMRCFLTMRALAISSTQPSARDVEIGSLDR